MKKFFVLCCILTTMFCFSTNVLAEDGKYTTAGELYASWGDEIPEYICGVWSTDGGANNVTFGIQNNDIGEAGKIEILELVENDSTASFQYQKYTRRELLEVQNGVMKYCSEDTGIISTSLNEQGNSVIIGVDSQKMDNEETKKILSELISQYGDAVELDSTSVPDLYHYGDTQISKSTSHLYLSIIVVFIFSMLVFFMLWFQNRRIMVMQTVTGENIHTGHRYSTKEIESMIKESEMTYPAEMDKKIIQKIKEVK